MNSKLNEYSDEENRKNNGKTVMSVLSHLGDAATADKICDEIVDLIHKPKEFVEPEVKRILRRGVSQGFLVKFGKNYLLSGREDITEEVDSKRKTYKNIGKRVKPRNRNIKSMEKRSDLAEHGVEEQQCFHKQIALRLDEIDGPNQNNHLVMVNPREVVNAIINDLYKSVQTSEENSDEQTHVIDFEAIISRNLNNLSKPCSVVATKSV